MDIQKIMDFNWLIKFGIIKIDENSCKVNKETKKNFWVSDSSATNCFDCENQFSTLLRMHHCRICGNIFCNNCSSKQIQLAIKNKNIKLRVCNNCFNICHHFSSLLEKKMINGEIKEQYFSNMYKNSINNYNQFLNFENNEKEIEIKNNINNIYELIIKNLTKNVLSEYFNEKEVIEWTDIIFLLIKQVINNLRTSTFFMNDSLNINKYIKIILIPNEDKSLCEVIPGFAMKKNISKDIKAFYYLVNPKILLINIENESLITKFDDPNSSQRNNEYFSIIEKKLELLNPDIILFGEIYPKSLLNNLKKNNWARKKVILFDIKKEEFHNIARCTDNITLTSLDLLGTNYDLGKCTHFDIKYIYLKEKVNNNCKCNEMKHYEEYHMIIFQGNPLLFNSIKLSGKDKKFLKKMKNILINILLPTARDLFLQKYLLYTFNMKIDNINDIKRDEEEEKIYSIFEKNKEIRPNELDKKEPTIKDLRKTMEMKKNNNNYDKDNDNDNDNKTSIIFFNKLLNIEKEEIIEKNVIKQNNNKKCSNSFYKGFDLSIICKKSDYANYSIIKGSKIIGENKNNNSPVEENKKSEIQNEIKNGKTYKNGENQIEEKNIHKIITKFCKPPTKIFLCFYCDNRHYDKTLDKFFFELNKEAKTNCKTCGDPLSKHINNLYKSNGMITVKLISDKEYDLDKVIKHIQNYNKNINNIIENNFKIFTYGYCNKCSNIVTPLFELSNEIANYSTSKFFRFLLENTNMENNHREYNYNIKYLTNNKKCNHLINKDISRIFITRSRSWLFEYHNTCKYLISPLKLNNPTEIINVKDKNVDNYNALIEKYIKEANNNCTIILEILKNYFLKQISGLEALLKDEKFYLFKTSINLLINIIIMGMRIIESLKAEIISVYLKEEIKFNFLQYIAIIKKIYIKIIQIKTIANTIDKSIVELNIISDILNYKIPFNYEENVKILEGKSKDIPIEIQLFDIEVDKTPKININFENNSTYLKILSFIEYYDDKHNYYSCDFINHDLSCIISTALSSDDYLNLINKNKNIKYTDIKCQRLPEDFDYDKINNFISSNKNNVLYLNMNKKKDRSNFHEFLEEEEIKEGSQDNNQNFDNSLIFNLSKNLFYIDKIEKNEKKIIDFLEKELCSNNKEEFDYTLTNNFCNFFDNNSRDMDSTNIITKNKELNNEGNGKENKISEIMEIEGINKEIDEIKNKLAEFNDLYIKQQRELNTLLKTLLKTKEKEKQIKDSNSSENIRESKNKKLNIYTRRKSNSFCNNNSEDKFIPISLNEKNNNNLINSINDDNQINILPSFPYMPEFLKIFELKKKKYYEEEIMEKIYPEYLIKVYFPHQFEALRTAFCATNEEFIKSIRKSIEWCVSGGKSKANFYKTFDNKYIIKNVSEIEFNMFIETGLNYFKHISKYLFHKMPSAIGKILGAFIIKMKLQGEKERNYYLIFMENIYYGMLTEINNYTFNSFDSNIMVYDLKGSKLNRYVQQKMKNPGKVLLDTNFLEDFNGEPLFFDFNAYKILQNALNNDSQFLKDEGIIDYSLIIIFEYDNNFGNKNKIEEEDKNNLKKKNFKIIRLGIIDYLRKYTWDKQIESYGKRFIYGFKNPTIINPDSYCERFMSKIKGYFVGI